MSKIKKIAIEFEEENGETIFQVFEDFSRIKHWGLTTHSEEDNGTRNTGLDIEIKCENYNIKTWREP
jgi:hypothetical protein